MILIKIDLMMMLLDAQEEVEFKGIREVLHLARDETVDPKVRLARCMAMLEEMGLEYHIAKKEDIEDTFELGYLEVDYCVEEIEVRVLNGRVKLWLGMN